MSKPTKKYIDRKGGISDKMKLPNVLKSVYATSCSTKHRHDIESRFHYKLTNSDNDPSILDALVLPNDICVIMSPDISTTSIISWKSLISISSNQISGKFKKRAQIISAGHAIFEVSLQDGTISKYRSPIGGQLLEINDMLTSSTSNNDKKLEYICILLPNTVIPSLATTSTTYDDLVKEIARKKNDRSCHAWKLSGSCSRGDSCKFMHDIAKTSTSSSHMDVDVSAGVNDMIDETGDDDMDDIAAVKKQKVIQ